MRVAHSGTNSLEGEKQWRAEHFRHDWLRPESEVLEIADLLREIGASRAMDLGCGIGRHSLMLAAMGFEVLALDESNTGIDFARSLARKAGNPIHFVTGLRTELPCADKSFDYVLAWDATSHEDRATTERLLSEISRVLRPGGILQGTMPSSRGTLFGMGRQRGPSTSSLEGEADMHHPLFRCNQSELKEFLWPMDLLRVTDREHGPRASYRLHFVAKKNNEEF